MKNKNVFIPRIFKYACGFSYVEVLIAVILLTICIVPAIDAMRSVMAAPLIAQDGTRKSLCVKSHMETVLAEPFNNLLEAAGPLTVPSARYSASADTVCPLRNVFIARFNPNGMPSVTTTDTGLLFVTVAAYGVDGTSLGTDFSFTSLVAR